MKKAYLLFVLLLFHQTSVAQQFEQIALDFYATTILSKQKELRVFYDGRIATLDSQYTTIGRWVIHNYYNCNTNLKKETNDSIKHKPEQDLVSLQKLYKSTLQPLTAEHQQLIIPHPIKKKRKLRVSKLRNHTLLKRLFSSNSPTKYNLFIQPAYQYKNSVYVWLSISKKNEEYGTWLIVEIDYKTKIIKDWCKTNWIQ